MLSIFFAPVFSLFRMTKANTPKYTKKNNVYYSKKRDSFLFLSWNSAKRKNFIFHIQPEFEKTSTSKIVKKILIKIKIDRKVLSSDKKCTSAISRELPIIYSIGLLIEYDLAQFSMFEYRFWAAILCHKTLKCTTISTASNNNTITDDKMK